MHYFTGVALRLITLGNSLETWENKMNVTMHGGSVLLDREWMNFYELIGQEWKALIDSAIGYINVLIQRELAYDITKV